MFFGRNDELNRLRNENATSFAVTGPGRIGKTSLITQYIETMIRQKDRRSRARFFISFYDCEDTTPEGIARFMAMSIHPSKRSHNIPASNIVKMLRRTRGLLGVPLELLLDEVDSVCRSEAFQYLGAAARLGLCRLILCGKGVLLKSVLDNHSLLECRLDVLKLEPLQEKPAQNLLLHPLKDLGFELIDQDKVVEEILRLTGRLPHLIQFCGKKLAEFSIVEKSDKISLEQVGKLKNDFITAQYFIKPLDDLDNPLARLIGLLLLKKKCKNMSVATVQALASAEHHNLQHKEALDLCNDLVINNVLAWDDGSFELSNEGLYYYALKLGYLDSALEDARNALKASSAR
jgi:hypothetical protein